MKKDPPKDSKRAKLQALALALASSSIVTTLVVVAISGPKLPRYAGE